MNRLIIVASIQGVQNVVRQIGSIGTAAQATARQANVLEGALGGIVTAVAIGMIRKYTDEFTNLQNRLKIVTTSTEDLAQVTDKLYGIAIQTRTAFTDTAKLYQRVALAGQQLGNSQDKNLRITELLNKAIIMSGSSTIEASNAMIQLSQGLAKGTLNGDELRSVLEQLPFVADLIAKQMGVTRGELRDLGAEGKITAEIVQEAILSAGDTIDTTFSKLTPTIGQAFVNLESALTRFLGKLNETTGFATGFAQAVLFVADNLNMLVGIATAAGTAFAVLKVSQLAAWLGEVLNVTIALNAVRGVAMQMVVPMTRLSLGLKIVQVAFLQAAAAARTFALANPFTAVIAGLTVLLPLMYAYGDQVNLTSDGTYTLRNLLDELGTALSTSVVPIMQVLGDALTVVGTGFGVLWSAVQRVLGIFTGYGDALQFMGGETMSVGKVVYALAEGLAYMARVIIAGPVFAFRALAEVMYALGLVNESAMAGLRAATDNALNLGGAALEAQARIAAYGTAQETAAVQTASASGAMASYAGSSNSAADATNRNTQALQQKQSWMLQEDILTTKIVNGQTQLVTVWNAGTNALNMQSTSLVGYSSALTVSADGVNAITASEAYYAEAAKKAAEATETQKSATSSLNKESIAPATTAVQEFGDKSKLLAGGLGSAADATTALKAGLSDALGVVRSISEALARSAENALKAAEAYREAAAAAREMRAAGGSPSGGQTLQHNGAARPQAAIRYHSGGLAGLRPDEYSAILQRGEEVLTRDDPRNRLNGGGSELAQAAQDPIKQAAADYGRPFVTVTNGLDVKLAEPLDRILDYLKSYGVTELPDVQAYTSAVDSRGYKGTSVAYADYNPLNPFGRAIADLEAQSVVGSMFGDAGLSSYQQADLDELKRLEDIWMQNFKGDWFTKDDLNSVMAQERAKPATQYDNQSLAPWQGEDGQRMNYGWNPDLVATSTGGSSGETKIEVKMEINGVKDVDSFRRNQHEIDTQVESMVRRASRRANR